MDTFNLGPADPQAAFRDMIRAVQVLRGTEKISAKVKLTERK